MKFTVVWFSVGAHGYHEVIATSPHAALAQVVALLGKELGTSAKYKVFEGSPLRGTDYCMRNMTFID